jgi:peroxiredoxin Q/BCP
MQSTKNEAQSINPDVGTRVGDVAPDFTLTDARGEEWNLSKQRGRVVVLLFYPGDETPICTKQMCSVRDRWEDYAATGAEVVGVSMDSVESHEKFAEHHELPLRLLADAGGSVSKAYDALSWFPGRSARAVVVVDAYGRIAYRKVQSLSLFRPKDDEVLDAIRDAGQLDDARAKP